ncbi:MAG: undecaprenyl/decaprenyl-phosphate alpha-N-acetylglucosaminyl 1-phosphate transferase [Chloroflexi bacterium]|nr:undecaprenyl/decaprenyl-phosphate alpha-N-acetylglucosaminyl 1-phosphate transferase [Chloroflexota bacterium]
MLYVAMLLLSFAVTFVTTPVSRQLAYRLGAIDAPKELGIHRDPVPRAGGVAIYLGWLAGIVAGGVVVGFAEAPPLLWLGTILAGTSILVLGLIDDVRGLSPLARLVGQIATGIVLLVAGVAAHILPPIWLDLAVSLIWFVALTNALNFLDGMDGLAAGVAIVAASFFAALAAIQGNTLALAFAAALIGSALAFLRFNVFPASIFMGDGGSLFLGSQLAILGVTVAQGQTSVAWPLASLLVLGVPLLDGLGAIVRRLRSRRSLFDGDRRHSYDLIFARGLSHAATVRVMWLLTALAGLCAVFLVQQPWSIQSAVVVTSFVAGAVALSAWLGLFSPAGPARPGGDQVRKVSERRVLQNGSIKKA